MAFILNVSPFYSTKIPFARKKPSKILSVSIIVLPLHSQTSKQGAIAQLVEQRTENPCVPGSIPGGTTCKTPKYLIIKCFGVFRFSHYTQ